MRFYRVLSALALAGIFFLGAFDSAQAQRGGGGFPFGGGRNRGRDYPRMTPTEQKPAEDKDKDKKDEDDKEKKEEEKKPEEPKDEGPPPIQRPLEPERPADPRELAVKPADDGKISFSFNGQPWPAVLEWLADVSNMSLEWEEAPAGYINLTTRGRYTVDEVRDLLNSVLLSKGFTVLRNGEVLIVANLKKLDSSLVPRVIPSELDERGTYELARTFFDLDWLIADQAADEIKPLLSPFGKATPLKATNRLDVLDTAGNLRRVRELLAEEQSDAGQQRLVREFKLRFTRADEVLDTLNLLLGIEPKQQAAANPVDPRQMMQAMMMAQQAGQGGMLQPGKKETNIFLAVNARENSILANAPPDKMGVIEQAIEAVDVPKARGGGLRADAQRFKVYRLSGLQPDTLAKVLKDLGSLDPTTKLEVDTKKNALIVYGPLVDHLLVTDLVERLDGASRKFEVIQLRTLSAEYVAGSIMTLMNGPEKQQEPRPRWMYFDSSSQQQDTTDKFWVEADIERNRLLLRANEVELAEVRALLIKLGEIPADQRFGNTTRVVPAAAGAEMKDGLERVKRLWQSVSPNPLEIEIDPRALEPPRRIPKPADDEAGARRRAAPGEARELPSGSREGQRGGQQRQNQGRGNRSADRVAPAGRFRLAQDRLEPKADEEPADDAADDQVDETKQVEEPKEANDTGDAAAATDADESDRAADVPTDDVADRDQQAPDDSAMEEAENVKEGTDEESHEPAASMDEESGPPTGPGDLPRRAHAPIKITLGPQGLVISSSDTDALDRLEELLNNTMPPRTNYELFTLKHTYAKDMVALLKDIFKADMSKDSNSRSEVFDMFWNGYSRGSSNQQARNTLSKRRPLNFVADPVTNTVLVQGADAAQLAEIDELIQRYDRAEPPNSESVRRTTRVALRYAKAKEVADVIKDVYRDLLSPNDKALIANQPQQQQGREQRSNDNFYSAMFSYLTDDPTKSEVVPRFKGMLSVGIDERANGVVISAPQIILTEVLKMVKDLDADARPARAVVRVLKVRNPGVGTQVEQAVAAKKAPTATPAEGTPAATNGVTANGAKGAGGNMPATGSRFNGSR